MRRVALAKIMETPMPLAIGIKREKDFKGPRPENWPKVNSKYNKGRPEHH